MPPARPLSRLGVRLAVAIAVGSAFTWAAAVHGTEAGPRQTTASAPTDSTLRSLAWLAGCWGTTQEGVEMEEHWTAPKGGLMLGLHRDVFASGRVFFEFLRIEHRPEGVFYVAQPRGLPPTDFRLLDAGERRVVFANPAHDFPQRILYWLDDAGVLHARTEGEADGETRSAEWTWPRVRCDR